MHHLATALDAARSRWHDESYCTRIMISNLIGDDWTRETGYGLNTRIMDNEHSIPVIDFSDLTVALYDYQFMSHGCELRDQKFRMPFNEFVKKFQKVLTTA
jgi:menaquinone-dependent protoporphyrinogen IX oxidase